MAAVALGAKPGLLMALNGSAAADCTGTDMGTDAEGEKRSSSMEAALAVELRSGAPAIATATGVGAKGSAEDAPALLVVVVAVPMFMK